MFDLFGDFLEFEWDRGNIEENWKRHQVTVFECEQVFFNKPLAVSRDPGHSSEEVRFFAFGRADAGRALAVVFTIRRGRIRVITARDMSQRERRTYESHDKENSEVQK